VRRTALPRKAPPGTPFTTGWLGPSSYWQSMSRAVDGGFFVALTCMQSRVYAPGYRFSGVWLGDWMTVKLALTVELQLREVNYYERLRKIEENGG
jgi:hypothetical protein